MRHQVSGRKLGRKTAHRTAMFRNMASSLIEHGQIQTTLHKAKELRKIADKLVTLGKEDSLHARRQAFDMIRNRDAVKKLFDVVAPAFDKRKGGYTRIVKIGTRLGDAAKMAVIEYLSEDILAAKVEGKVSDAPKKAKKAKATKKAAPKKEAASKKTADKKESKAKKAPAKKKEAAKKK